MDEKHCDKPKILNDLDRCLKDTQASISIKFTATQKSLNTVFVELYGSVITYKGYPSLVGNIINLESINPTLPHLKDTNGLPIKLSSRELEVLQLICNGKSTLETSKSLFLGQRTIETYRANLLEKTETKNIAELIMYAIRNNLIIID